MGSSRTIFDRILEEAEREGYRDVRQRASKIWLRERARDVPEVSEDELVDDSEHRLHALPGIGGMYLFKYDPKTKAKLPYYDAFPLIFPTDFTADGFRGINLHYLPHGQRAVLMDKLYSLNTDPNMGPDARLALSYNALAGLTEFTAFKPCFKRYLFSKCQSRFLKIMPEEWEIALFLPLERFEKASASRIYNESLAQIRLHRRRLF